MKCENTDILARAGILTRPQLMRELDITTETLTRWEDDDEFPGRRIGRTALYDVDAIKAWINEKR